MSSAELKDDKICFPEADLAKLCHLPFQAVQALHIYRDSCSIDKRLTSQALPYIGKCLPSLQVLDMDFNNLSDLEALRSFPPGLQVLKVIGNTALADADFAPVGSLPQLRSLYIQSFTIRSERFRKFSSRSIQEMDLGRQESMDFQEMGLRFPELRVLTVRGLQLDRPMLSEIFQHEKLLSFQFSQAESSEALRPEDRPWAIREASGLLIDNFFSEAEVLDALAANPNLKKAYVNRYLSEAEERALFKRPLELVVFNYNEGGWYASALKTAAALGPEVQVQHIVVDRASHEFSKDERASIRKSLPERVRLTEYEKVWAINDWATAEVVFQDLL